MRPRGKDAPKRPEKPEPAFRPLGLAGAAAPERTPSGPAAEMAFRHLRRTANLRSEGLQHASGLRGAAVIVSNHTSLFDAPMVLAALPRAVRASTLVAVESAYAFKVRGNSRRVVRVLEQFPFTVYDGSPAAGERCLGALARGWRVLMFPEGTRSTTARLASFRRGPARLCLAARVPAIPAWIEGTQQAWGSGGGLARPAVLVRFGPPVQPLAGEEVDALTARLHEAVRILGGAPS